MNIASPHLNPQMIRKVMPDGPGVITKTLMTTSEAPSDASPTSRQRWLKMATSDVDRAGDVIVLSGMDATDFLLNPQFLWQHGTSGAQTNTIGKILRLEQTSSALYALAEYADETTSPLAEQIFRMDEAGLLPANSIGFRPIEWEANAFGGLTFTKWQLIECSKVELPMNPKAIDERSLDFAARVSAKRSSITAESAAEWILKKNAEFARSHSRPNQIHCHD